MGHLLASQSRNGQVELSPDASLISQAGPQRRIGLDHLGLAAQRKSPRPCATCVPQRRPERQTPSAGADSARSCHARQVKVEVTA